MSQKAIKKLSECQYLIEATRNEEHNLWYMHTQVYKTITEEEWKQLIPRYLIQVGEIDSRPVSICLSFVNIKGVNVCFYDSPSQVVDWKMIEAWLDKHFSKMYNGQSCRCDAANFHQCLGVIDELCFT